MATKVLVIDDSGLTREQVKTMLEEVFSVEVLTAENGEAGLEVLGANPDVELVVCDIEMPVMGGVEVVRRVRADDDTAFLPILVMSTLGRVQERNDALNSGADAFIEKPVTREALEDIVKDLL